jgi:hypothetical protein
MSELHRALLAVGEHLAVLVVATFVHAAGFSA